MKLVTSLCLQIPYTRVAENLQIKNLQTLWYTTSKLKMVA